MGLFICGMYVSREWSVWACLFVGCVCGWVGSGVCGPVYLCNVCVCVGSGVCGPDYLCDVCE